MPISDPTLYSNTDIGPGRIATLEPYRVNVETAGADIKFGQAVVLKGGNARNRRQTVYIVGIGRIFDRVQVGDQLRVSYAEAEPCTCH